MWNTLTSQQYIQKATEKRLRIQNVHHEFFPRKIYIPKHRESSCHLVQAARYIIIDNV